ncbi:hypothetical protein R1flu_019952 [Riccia fluitans]|uniref:Uncharacterized protein n=1 Tax=Riccia fluitans TaxID=41844 RepID=A0ABD1ZK42_9MARC
MPIRDDGRTSDTETRLKQNTKETMQKEAGTPAHEQESRSVVIMIEQGHIQRHQDEDTSKQLRGSPAWKRSMMAQTRRIAKHRAGANLAEDVAGRMTVRDVRGQCDHQHRSEPTMALSATNGDMSRQT